MSINRDGDDDPIDMDALERTIAEMPPGDPETDLEFVVEEQPQRAARWFPDKLVECLEEAKEAQTILDRWDRAATAGDPVPLEQRRFEAAAFFTRYGYPGAEGFPLPHQHKRPQTRN